MNEGTVKWVVTEAGDLLISPNTVNAGEISHAVLSGGKPVLAAGQAQVAWVGGKFLGMRISRFSGHFMPTAESVQVGREAFARHGITFPQ
ncbi:hypothetical protein WME94_52015 [Sorangium sp. So ce429]